MIPVIAVAVGALGGGEHLNVRDILGALLVIAGVWLALGRPTPPLRAATGSPPHDRSLAGAPGD
jgi:drug/metabolite transporter (DMT)-like permease